jgi:hypothetical protein
VASRGGRADSARLLGRVLACSGGQGRLASGEQAGDERTGALPAGGRRARKPGRVAPSLRGCSSDGSREAGGWDGCLPAQAAARRRRADGGVAEGARASRDSRAEEAARRGWGPGALADGVVREGRAKQWISV